MVVWSYCGTNECNSLSLGGGFGVLTGRHGLVIDNLLGARMVLADGSAVQVDQLNNPDVSWKTPIVLI